MDSTRNRLSRLGGLAVVACLITAVVGLATSYSIGTSMALLAMLVVLTDRNPWPPGARPFVYGLTIIVSVALTVYMVQRALAGGAA